MWARFRCILQMPTPFSTLQRHCTGATFPAFGEVTGKLVLRVIEVTTSQVHMRNTLMLPVVTDAYGGASSCTCVPHTPFTSPLWHTFCKSSATGIASGGALEHAIRIGLLELCVWCHQLGNGKRELGKYSVSPPPIITMGRRIVRYHPPPPHTHTHTPYLALINHICSFYVSRVVSSCKTNISLARWIRVTFPCLLLPFFVLSV